MFWFGVVLISTCLSFTSANPADCACTFIHSPVCGTDGLTYANPCLLECVAKNKPDLTIKKQGECEEICICTLNYLPVCGTNGKTYPNKCGLECEKAKINVDVDYEGECKEQRRRRQVNSACVCTREAKPVCGTNGVTYGNPCMLNCARETDPSIHLLRPGRC